ncbi:sigma-70 family RNA polymerase sigma factor [Humitalea rosea]
MTQDDAILMDEAVSEVASSAERGLPPAEFHRELVQVLPKLRVQALSMTRNRSDADDLVQASLVNALSARTSFEPGTNLGAWLYRIMRNRFLSDMRRRRPTVDMDDAPQEAFTTAPSQEDNVALRELRVQMARLPEDQRTALVMVTVQGMSYDQVAELTGVAVGTAKCRVFRARKQLQAWLVGDAKPAPSTTRGVAASAQASQSGVRRSVSSKVREQIGHAGHVGIGV